MCTCMGVPKEAEAGDAGCIGAAVSGGFKPPLTWYLRTKLGLLKEQHMFLKPSLQPIANAFSTHFFFFFFFPSAQFSELHVVISR